MGKGVYHIQDPVENLKIRINLREVSSSHSLSANNSKKRPLFDQIIEFSWQEKIYGPRDVADYMLHKKSSYGRQTQLDSRRALGNLERTSGQPVSALLSDIMLYSYCNDEPFYPPQRPIVSEGGGDSSGQFDSYLSYALEPATHTGSEDSRQEKAAGRVLREEGGAAKHMQICLATDIRKDAPPALITSELSEAVLCSIKLTKDGLLVVSPGFSHVIAEESQVLHYDTELEEKPGASTSSLFINNSTIRAGLQKGFRLSTHRLRTSAGEEFEYSIENVNGVLSPIETEELMAAELRKDLALSEQSRGTSRKVLDPNDPDQLNKWNHSPVPAPYTHMTSLYAEIVSASGFSSANMYVRYQLLLPEGRGRGGGAVECILRTSFEEQQKQRQQLGANGVSDCNLDSVQSPLHKDQEHLPVPSPPSGPLPLPSSSMDLIGHTQVSSAVASAASCHHLLGGEGDDRLSLSPSTGLFLESNPSARFLLGTLLLVSSVLAVWCGPAYPFWLVPALAFWLLLLPGPLATSSQMTIMAGLADATCSSSPSGAHLKHGGHCDTDFVLAVAGGSGSRVVGPVVAESITVFGHPFQCDVYVRDSSSVGENGETAAPAKPNIDVSPSTNQATLFLEVFSVNSFERHTLEGCGYVYLPVLPSGNASRRMDVDVSTWKPIGDHKSRLVDAFLGGGAHLTNVRHMEVPNKGSSAVSKFGTRTESAGVVRVKCQAVTYAPALGAAQGHAHTEGEGFVQLQGSGAPSSQLVRHARKGEGGTVGHRSGAGGAKRTVEDILNSYKSTDLLSRSISRSTLRSSGQHTPPPMNMRGVSLWGTGDSDSLNSQDDSSLAVLSVDRIADIVARARANTEGLRNEGKESNAAPSQFSKPRGVPRPHTAAGVSDNGRTPKTGEDEKVERDRDKIIQEDYAKEGRVKGDRDIVFLPSDEDEDGSRQSDSDNPFHGFHSSGDEHEEGGGDLMDRFEAAGVTKKKKKAKSGAKKLDKPSIGAGGGMKSNSGNTGILMGGKPLKPLNPLGGGGRGLDKVFGSDSSEGEGGGG